MAKNKTNLRYLKETLENPKNNCTTFAFKQARRKVSNIGWAHLMGLKYWMGTTTISLLIANIG